MSDYDLQFQADLERAQALSLESLAFDQFKRQRSTSTVSSASVEDNEYRAAVCTRSAGPSPVLAPALPPPPRRTSRASQRMEHSISPTIADTDDLISFTHTKSNQDHEALKEHINQIQSMTKQTEEISLVPNSYNTYPNIHYNNLVNSTSHYMYRQQTTSTTSCFPTSPYPPYPSSGLPRFPNQPPFPYSNMTRLVGPTQSSYISNTRFTSPTSGPNNTSFFGSVDNKQPIPNTNDLHSNRSSQNSMHPDFSRRMSELSNLSDVSNEFNDTVSSLPNSANLIDFASGQFGNTDNVGSVRVSVLEAFDPLLTDQNTTEYVGASEGSSSVYDEFDPLDFLYGETEMREAAVYATISKREGATASTPLPSPPPLSSLPPLLTHTTLVQHKLYDSIKLLRSRYYDSELVDFLETIKKIRGKYKHDDISTNPGYVIAPRTASKYAPNTSIKLLVYHSNPDDPVIFTSDVESTVEHVIMHVICELEGEFVNDMSEYMLRVWGVTEYLTPGSSLRDYEYIRLCVRLEKDVRLVVVSREREAKLSRVLQDDVRASLLTLDDLLQDSAAPAPASLLSFDNLNILLETLEGELSRAVGVMSAEGSCQPSAVVQAVKAICALAGGVETLHITHALAAFSHACGLTVTQNTMKPEIASDGESTNSRYSRVTLRMATGRESVAQHCQRVREAVRSLLQLYARTHEVDFQLTEQPDNIQSTNISMEYCSHLGVRSAQFQLLSLNSIQRHAVRLIDALQYVTQESLQHRPDVNFLFNEAVSIRNVRDTLLVCVEAVHRPPCVWRHEEFVVQVQVYHGTRPLKGYRYTQHTNTNYSGFYPRILFDTWLNLEEVAVATLPREARLVLTLYGRTAAPDETGRELEPDQEQGQKSDLVVQKSELSGSSSVRYHQQELGWTALQLFNFDGLLASGSYLLPLWPVCSDKRLGPAPHPMQTPSLPHAAIHIEIPAYTSSGVRWPLQEELREPSFSTKPEHRDFESLDAHTQLQLLHLVEQGAYQRMPIEGREILWEKRQYLMDIPGALPLVLQAATSWDFHHREQLMCLVRRWKMPHPLNALHLLLPCFPDAEVGEIAVECLQEMSDDTLCGVMPQLVQALRHETQEGGALARALLERSLRAPAVAHRLYWLLLHALPQNWNNDCLVEHVEWSSDKLDKEAEVWQVMSDRWRKRYQLLLRALLAMLGGNLEQRLLRQQALVKGMTQIANAVKTCKEGARNRTLTAGVQQLAGLARIGAVALPLSLSTEIQDLDTKSCSYFASNTLPLKINFIGNDNAVIPAMFKVGDDLRQDALVLQVMHVMDSLWLQEELDLRMVTFQAVPTQHRKGMIEIVSEAETLRAIQTEWGLTGSFKDRPIAEWLAKHNPSELEYERARDNFTASCAGYSVATYLLGICDRHNDNIMLKTSGHLFHIDFGKFLGDAQMFGNFKRDRAPFVLTPDMAYVINGGERPTQRFHYFVELCCNAFNIVRRHHDHILDLFALMATSGVAGVSMGAVSYVSAALLPGATQAEAAAAFARLIHSSLKSKFTPINFFLHNLAQLRAAGGEASTPSELLSFMPRTYTMAQEGRLTSVEVLGYEKRYDPDKHYVYSLRIYRQGQVTPFVLYRSYKHFTEFYQKLCVHFPLAKVHSLPMGLHVGRSAVRQVAERRYADVQAFLTSLFVLADEIAHSDLVYTFFHPLLRDQQDAVPQRIKHKEEASDHDNSGSGSIKISVQYTTGVLSVLILHAQSLALTPQGLPPNAYVKVYLVPDPSKETKRKTRVLKRNSHPSFMEMLEYRMPMEVVRSRTLQATVWHYDSLQENTFLGGVILPLSSLSLREETVGWYPLEYIPR